MRGQRGQAASEYLGVLLVVAFVLAALIATGIGGQIAGGLRSAVCTIGGSAQCGDAEPGGSGDGGRPLADAGPDTDGDGLSDAEEIRNGSDPAEADTDLDGLRDGEDPAPRERDADGDGLSDGEESALGTDPRRGDSDGDGLSDREEYEQGTDPTLAVAPLTDENRLKPWERLGISQDEWSDFVDAVLDEVNPGGWEGFLFGNPYFDVTLSEDGEIELLQIQENGIGSVVRIITGGGRALSAAQAAARAASRLPSRLSARLTRLGVLPGAARLRRPPGPPATPGTALGELDELGRPIGASATITRDMIGTGTRARVDPPGFGGQAAGHARGHLIGRQLGGSGSDPRNIVTLFQNPANTPVMSRFEGLVRGAVEAGETVRYTVTPIYRGAEAIPRGVTLTARGSGGFRLDVTVLNKGRP